MTPPYESLLVKLQETLPEEDEDIVPAPLRKPKQINYEVFMRAKSRPSRLAAREILVSVVEHYRDSGIRAYDHRGGKRPCRD